MILLRSAVIGFIGIAFSAPSWALNVLACEPEWAELAEELAPHADIYSATSGYQDPHYIEARPSLVAKARKADLLFCTGAELEVGWLPILLRQAGNRNIQPDQPGYLMAAEQVERIEIPEVLSRSMGDVHAAGNPHVHLDPHRLLQIAEVLRDRLIAIEPEKADEYRQRYLSFASRWASAITEWEALALPLKGAEYVSYHKSFSYLSDWLGMQRVGTLEPKPGIPPSAKHVQALLRAVADKNVRAVITSPAQPSRDAERFGKKLGVPALVLPLSPGVEGADDLFAMFQVSIDRLLAAKQ